MNKGKAEENESSQKVYIYSNGCVPNRLEGKNIQDFFEKIGWELLDDYKDADLIVFNACAFSGDRMQESIDFINLINKEMKGKTKLILTGCLYKIAPDSVGPLDNGKVLDISEFGKEFSSEITLSDLKVSDSLVDILETTREDIFNIITSKGCLGRCSFCAIKKARGSVKSKPEQEIIEEFDGAIERGFKKFILWGDDLGAYGADISTNYVKLLGSLINSHSADLKYSLFLHRLNPQWIIRYFSEFSELIKTDKIRMVYAPIQSGSNKILRLMQREYNIETAAGCLSNLKLINPSLILKTDIMVGFPDEREDDFKKTMDIILELKLDDIVLFKYVGIPDTPAYNMPGQVDENLKDARINAIWKRFPSFRFSIDFQKNGFWIKDKKLSILKGPLRPNYYISFT